jgi:hypothetical protein
MYSRFVLVVLLCHFVLISYTTYLHYIWIMANPYTFFRWPLGFRNRATPARMHLSESYNLEMAADRAI